MMLKKARNRGTALASAVAWTLACGHGDTGGGPQDESVVDGGSSGDGPSQAADAGVAPQNSAPAADTGTAQGDGPDTDTGTAQGDGATLDSGTSVEGDTAKVYDVTLTTTAVTPVCASAGAAATGHATVTIDPANSMIAVTNFTFSGLAGTPTMVHLHYGAAGTDGGIVFHFAKITSPINQAFTTADYASPGYGAPPTFAGFVTALRAGQSYLQVHTTVCQGGELRAQIQ